MAVWQTRELVNTFMGLPVNVRRHSIRVGIYAQALATCGLSQLTDLYPGMDDSALLAAVRDGGQYHDLGKLLVSPYVLKQPGALLSEDERELLRQHPLHTAALLQRCVGGDTEGAAHWELVQQIGLCHHERYDGRGYPNGLKGEEVPFVAQLVLLADSFDKLTSIRTAHVRLGFAEAFTLLMDQRGSHYGPDAADCLEAAREELQRLYKFGNQTRSRY